MADTNKVLIEKLEKLITELGAIEAGLKADNIDDKEQLAEFDALKKQIAKAKTDINNIKKAGAGIKSDSMVPEDFINKHKEVNTSIEALDKEVDKAIKAVTEFDKNKYLEEIKTQNDKVFNLRGEIVDYEGRFSESM